MTVLNIYWYNEDSILLAITTGDNKDMGEGWIVISKEEYDKKKELTCNEITVSGDLKPDSDGG